MSGLFRKLIILFFLPVVLYAMAGVCFAGERQDRNTDNLAVVLLIDISGSMRYTDPAELRETAACLFVDLLGTEDYLAVLTFERQVKILAPLEQIKSASHKAQLKRLLSGSLAPGGDTDYQAALKAAYLQLQSAEIEGYRPVVVMLTDGEPDPEPLRRNEPGFMESYMASLWETVDGFTLAGWPVYTIGFSEEIDPAVVERISVLTRGDHYLLDTPVELLAAFYELLETLKNRQRFIDQRFSSQDAPQLFTFTVAEQTNQVNLVLESAAGRDPEISLVPPGRAGNGADPDNVFVIKGAAYSLIVIHQPRPEQVGEWQINVSGGGAMRITGNQDKLIKVWLVEPPSGAPHPLGEPLQFKVSLTGAEQMRGPSLRVELQLAKPGQAAPVLIPLEEIDSYFTGAYSAVDRTGVYDLLVSVFMEGELLSTAVSRLQVENLPHLTADFWVEEGYRLGEELALAAYLQLGGHRITEGNELKVDRFNFVFTYTDDTISTVPVYDSGNPAHGDLEAGDGIWSNLYSLNVEGAVSASLIAAGRYRDTEFLLEKNFGDFLVAAPGTIAVSLAGGDLFTIPGRRMAVPLQIENRSALAETLLIGSSPGGQVYPFHSVIDLEPGETVTYLLELELHEGLDPGEYSAPLQLFAGHPLTLVETGVLHVTFDVVSLWQYIRLKADQIPAAVLTAIFVVIAAGMLLYAGGAILYHILVRPQMKLGELHYRAESETKMAEDGSAHIDLGRKGASKVVVSFDTDSTQADFIAGGGDFSHALIFSVRQLQRQPFFLRGWLALFSRCRQQPALTYVECTRPGVIEHRGRICTRKELFHGDEFKSGGFVFKYHAPHSATYEQGSGANLLESRV